MTFDDHRAWYSTRTFPEESLARMRRNTREVLPEVWKEFALPLDGPVTWSVNLPDPCESPELVRTRLGRTYYRRCFSQRGDQYYHNLERFPIDDAPDTDQAVVAAGHVSATLIDLDVIGQRLER
jgi:broad specificity polyphosphatase/5'/3'-nucleotidase SurE